MRLAVQSKVLSGKRNESERVRRWFTMAKTHARSCSCSCSCNHDPYAFIFHTTHISNSQEQILQNAPFVTFLPPHTPNSPVPEIIDLVSSPASQEPLPQDVFHTPPEDSPLPSSDDPLRPDSDGVYSCTANHAVDDVLDAQGLVEFCSYSDGSEFVDLGRDSELGFSEAQLTQEIDVPQCSLGDGLGKIPNKFGVMERELSDFHESPLKKSKLLENNHFVADVEGNKSSDAVLEASGGVRGKSDEELGLPSSKRGRSENAGSDMECGEVRPREKNKCSVFDVLKILSENSHEDEDEDDVDDGVSLLEFAKRRGVTFARPRWWPDSFK